MTFATYRQIAEHCASLRDSAGSAPARSRLENERNDWQQLAQSAGLARNWAFVRTLLGGQIIPVPRP